MKSKNQFSVDRKETVLELEVTDIAFGGSGVARQDGKVYFIPFTAPGDRVRVRVTRDRRKFAEAELLEVLGKGAGRVEPVCQYFGRCGGCAYQHLEYGAQVRIKSAQVEQTLRRVGRLDAVPMETAISASEPLEYRNRIRVHVRGRQAGFYAAGSNALVDVERCAIARPEVNAALRRLRGAGLEDGDYSLRAPGGGGPFFEQTNAAMAREMVRWVGERVVQTRMRLVDAYCGAGLFARNLSGRFPEVVGIEENLHAVESARSSAQPHERYLCGDVAEHLGPLLEQSECSEGRWIGTVLLLDPPATGLGPGVLDLILENPPDEIFYVSCNPATLARDMARLTGEFELVSVVPVDMFPQTAEIEVITHLKRRGAAR
jgi:23S rRNA (uracil1939-C5)-methyltransferase